MTDARPPSSPVEAYDRGAGAWATGADPAYQRYATALVSLSPPSWVGATVADIASGSGATSGALVAAGARPVAIDGAPAMLALAQRTISGLPVVAGDALRLPIASSSLEGAVIGFCVNHVPEPWALLAEAGRVVRPGAAVLVSTFARGGDHPAKAAVDAAARTAGWRPSEWYTTFREHASHSDTADRLAACADRAGLTEPSVLELHVDTGIDTAAGLVAWRLGMPELAAFVDGLDAATRAHVISTAAASIGPEPEPLVRRVLLLRAVSPG